jgi:hypothetical protein
MAERVRTYSEFRGKFHLGLAGFWVLLALLNTAMGDRLFSVFCLISVLGSGLNGANELWWRGTNRWFKPAMWSVAAAMIVFAGVFISRMVGDVRAQF